MMRLKKSSSGIVGPRTGGGGGAQRWSSKRDPWSSEQEGRELQFEIRLCVFICSCLEKHITVNEKLRSRTSYFTCMKKIREIEESLGLNSTV